MVPPDAEVEVLRLPPATLTPLLALVDDIALVEHAVLGVADPSSGHCADDAGRALALACTMADDPLARDLAALCLEFLASMHLGGGQFRLRDGERDHRLRSSDDASARAIHGIGVAAAAPWRAVRVPARRLFAEVVEFESVHLRARAHAVLGAVSAAGCDDVSDGARALVDRLAVGLDEQLSADWPWPEHRLSYGNALLAEATLAAAALRNDWDGAQRGLSMLRWLIGVETAPGHLSVTPVGGWARGEPRPGFDQQPIEVWALADAAWRAVEVTGDGSWGSTIGAAAAWFAGVNDTATMMWDPSTGRSYDGLQRHGVNRNEGSESALALVATLHDLDRVRCFRPRVDQAARRSSR